MECVLTIMVSALISTCQTYYQKNAKFNQAFQQGRMEQAEDILAKDKKGEKGKDRLLYYFNMGTVNSLEGDYDLSNVYFEKAYLFAEDFHKNAADVTSSLLVNPKVSTYYGEKHEVLYINYYKAINYLQQADYEKALVETRRMNLRLQQYNDRYKGEGKFKRDAFIHLIMGMAYEASGETNDAFIAFRNALEIYQTDYKRLFNAPVPEQLKEDILRTAYLSNLWEELGYYEKEFGMTFDKKSIGESSMFFLWQNGLGPVKDETSLTFTVVKGSGGVVNFNNSQMGLTFPFPVSSSNYHNSGLEDLRVVRIAFPKYIERRPFFSGGTIVANGKQYQLNKAENVNAVAKQCLEDRMLQELSTSLLRVAIKQAAAYAVSQQNEAAGMAVSVAGAISEQADTRNWQTLPHTIFYTRVPLQEGENIVQLNAQAANGATKSYDLQVIVPKGRTIIKSFSTFGPK